MKKIGDDNLMQSFLLIITIFILITIIGSNYNLFDPKIGISSIILFTLLAFAIFFKNFLFTYN